jgi:steroid delta-isomerase-like uncharacterized protein
MPKKLLRKCGSATFLNPRGGRAPQGGVLGALVISAMTCVGMTLAACTHPALTEAKSMTPEQNKAIVRAYLEEISNQGNLLAFDRYFSADVVFNQSRDVKQQLARRQAIRTAFPDHHLVIEDQIAEGDRVVTRVTFRGTHLGEFNGIAATGKQVVYAGTAIDRLVDGKVVEMWHVANTMALLQQIGGVIAAPPK